MKTPHTAALAAAIVITTTAASQAAVTASIAGGSGTPVSVTLSQDIVFTGVTTGMTTYGFVLIGAGSGSSDGGDHTGTAGWNGGGTVSGAGSLGSFAVGSVTSSDLTVFWASSGDQPASTATMTLNAGTRFTNNNITSAFPQGSAIYEIRMLNEGLSFTGAAGTAVPEPTAALLFLFGAGFFLRRKR